MSVDKRAVSTDALETLGTIISENEKRDAIHLAVIPMVAEHRMVPGAHVGIVEGKASAYTAKRIGIVDPFLTQDVMEGERFWLVIYPRKITSLRHVWTHPDIDEETVPVKVVHADKATSEQWLRNFLTSRDVNPDSHPYAPDDDELEGMTAYACVLDKALQRETSDKGGEDDLFFGFDIYGSIPPEFWDHVEVVTGRTIPKENRAEYFSCAC